MSPRLLVFSLQDNNSSFIKYSGLDDAFRQKMVSSTQSQDRPIPLSEVLQSNNNQGKSSKKGPGKRSKEVDYYLVNVLGNLYQMVI